MGRHTLFVIGAGASRDFGFPTGAELASSIQNKVDVEFAETAGRAAAGPLSAAFLANTEPEVAKSAARALRAGIGPGESIDQFLFRRRTRPEVRELGMLAIADIILEAERSSKLNEFDLDDFDRSVGALRSNQNGWPAVLTDLLIGGRGPHEIDEGLFENVAFLIFNYDRCVEHLMFNHLHFRHDVPAEGAVAIIESIPTVHIFGVLGDPFHSSVRFGASSVELASVAKRLQTYHEQIADAERQAAVAAVMSEAERVCFLGFGFLPANFERLFPSNTIGNRLLCGTSMGAQWSPAFRLAESTPNSDFADLNPTMFLRERGSRLLEPPFL